MSPWAVAVADMSAVTLTLVQPSVGWCRLKPVEPCVKSAWFQHLKVT